ncbi:hypothetical protein ACRQ5I_00425 [Pseudoramibacter alactolyticus]|uniref:hypothetical protein n=1 Tax=Pseudoramibacter alactolyticus TaxID=113287 RepID=UPI0003128770|nr:hypothetical protein [Pseudoramibacter alactolyticus]
MAIHEILTSFYQTWPDGDSGGRVGAPSSIWMAAMRGLRLQDGECAKKAGRLIVCGAAGAYNGNNSKEEV